MGFIGLYTKPCQSRGIATLEHQKHKEKGEFIKTTNRIREWMLPLMVIFFMFGRIGRV